jgi:serine/threonine protein kinase
MSGSGLRRSDSAGAVEGQDSVHLPAGADFISFSDLTLGPVIGQGAYGQVLSGTYRGAPAAIKRGSVRNRDAQAKKYLEQELEALSANEGHPHLIKYYGACLHAGAAYIAIEFMPGGDLNDLLLDTSVALPWALLARLAHHAADGMACLHARGLIHRDIKADNILLDDSWRAVLADYGFARRVEGAGAGRPAGGFMPAAMTIAGTTANMAPEVLFGESYDQRADVFSFGTVLAQLLVRKAPGSGGFLERGPRGKFALDLPALRAACPADAPASLVECTVQCLAYEPDDRLDSAMVVEWLGELVRELGGEGEEATAGMLKPSELQRVRKERKGAGLGLPAGGASE